jgi:hypothetical protein
MSISWKATTPPGATQSSRRRGAAAGSEVHVAEAGVAGAPLGRRDRLGGVVEADDRAGRPDQPGGQERHVAGAAADVEHPHARADAGPTQDPGGEVAEEARLVDQTVQLVVVVPEDVAGAPPAKRVGLRHCRASCRSWMPGRRRRRSGANPPDETLPSRCHDLWSAR